MEARNDLAAEAVATGLAGIVPGGSVAEGLIRRLAGKALAEMSGYRRRVIRAVEVASGMTFEEVVQEIDNDARLQPLSTRVLVTSVQTGHDRVLDALGAALGTAVSDRSRIDEAELLLIATKDLVAHHFQALECLAGDPPPMKPGSESHSWNVVNAAQTLGWNVDLATLSFKGLVNAGLAQEWSGFGGGFIYGPSEFGRSMLDVTSGLADR